jgi:4'-phosphopantetheinyl transferase
VAVVTLALVAPPAEIESLERLLSPSERARAARSLPEVGRRFIVGRGRLRRLLGTLLGERADAIELVVGPHGKPALGGRFAGRCHFNVAHSHDRGLLALAAEAPVGIDLELRTAAHTPPWAALMARSVLDDEELARWRGLPEEHGPGAILEAWACKEAILKAIGRGIGGGVRQVRLPRPVARIPVPRAGGTVDATLSFVGPIAAGGAHTAGRVWPEDLCVGLLDLDASASAAIACRGPSCRISLGGFDAAVRDGIDLEIG